MTNWREHINVADVFQGDQDTPLAARRDVVVARLRASAWCTRSPRVSVAIDCLELQDDEDGFNYESKIRTWRSPTRCANWDC